MRVALIEPSESDPSGHERVIGESDLTSINDLDRGRRAAASVCRTRAPAEGANDTAPGFSLRLAAAPAALWQRHRQGVSYDYTASEWRTEANLDPV